MYKEADTFTGQTISCGLDSRFKSHGATQPDKRGSYPSIMPDSTDTTISSWNQLTPVTPPPAPQRQVVPVINTAHADKPQRPTLYGEGPLVRAASSAILVGMIMTVNIT